MSYELKKAAMIKAYMEVFGTNELTATQDYMKYRRYNEAAAVCPPFSFMADPDYTEVAFGELARQLKDIPPLEYQEGEFGWCWAHVETRCQFVRQFILD